MKKLEKGAESTTDVRLIDAKALVKEVSKLLDEWAEWMDSGAEYDELDFDLYSCLLDTINKMPTFETFEKEESLDAKRRKALPFEVEEERQMRKLVRELVGKGWSATEVCVELNISMRKYYWLLR